jgi:hypothetical protein
MGSSQVTTADLLRQELQTRHRPKLEAACLPVGKQPLISAATVPAKMIEEFYILLVRRCHTSIMVAHAFGCWHERVGSRPKP